MEFVDRNGAVTLSVPIERMREALHDRYVYLRRPDLEHILLERAKSLEVAIRFATSVTALSQNEAEVIATFNSGESEAFALAFGADGVHSQVRSLIFGSEQAFASYLGGYVAAFHMENPRVELDHALKLHEEIDRVAAFYPLGKDVADATFVFRHPDIGHVPASERLPLLKEKMSGPGWMSAHVLEDISASHPVYFDSLTQIRMPSWHHGRVALLGDACGCLTLLAGQGSQMAMADAYVLATELQRHAGDHAAAFKAYQDLMKPAVTKTQAEAERFSRIFIPSKTSRMWLRHLVTGIFFSRLGSEIRHAAARREERARRLRLTVSGSRNDLTRGAIRAALAALCAGAFRFLREPAIERFRNPRPAQRDAQMTYLPAPTRYDTMTYRRSRPQRTEAPRHLARALAQFRRRLACSRTMREMCRTAFDLGITHFDLANNYGPPPGSAEENFGQILEADFRGLRDELIISTKAGYNMWPGPYGEWGSRKYLLSSLDQSLKRMGLDYVDIFYSHRVDPDTPLEETMGALDAAVRQGKALYVGISSYNSRAHRRGGGNPARARHALPDPPAELLDAEPLDRGRPPARHAGEEGIGCIVVLAARARHAHQQISEGRARPGAAPRRARASRWSS